MVIKSNFCTQDWIKLILFDGLDKLNTKINENTLQRCYNYLLKQNEMDNNIKAECLGLIEEYAKKTGQIVRKNINVV